MAFFLPWFGCRPHRFSAFGSILAQEQGRQQQRNPSAWNLFLPRRGFGERGTFRRHNKSRPYPTNQASEQQRVIANSQSLLRFFRDQFSILGAADTDSPGSSVHGTDLWTVSERASVGAESRLVRARGRKFGTTKRMYQKNRGRRRRPVICECLKNHVRVMLTNNAQRSKHLPKHIHLVRRDGADSKSCEHVRLEIDFWSTLRIT